jgi:uncharacterized protein (TIRG00374 family)
MKALRLLFIALSFVLLGYLIGQLGFDTLLDNLYKVRWGFLLILIPSCIWHLSNTIAWNFAFPADAFKPRLRSLFAAKLAGEAVNQLTPLANMGGEPLKAYLLKKSTPGPRGLASVVIDKTAQLVVGLIFTVGGLAFLFDHHDLSRFVPLSYKVGLVFLLTASALGLWLFSRKQDRLFTSLFNLLRRLGLKKHLTEKNMKRAERVDTSVGYFYREHKVRFLQALFFQSIGWFMGTCETYVILHVLDAGIGFEFCFLLTALGTIVNSLFFFMPSNIGVMEGGQVFLFTMLGLNPALGLSMGLLKRLRRIFWILVGWLFLTRFGQKAYDQHASPSPAFTDAAKVN